MALQMTFSEIIKGMEEKQFEYGFQYAQDNGNTVKIILGKSNAGEIYVSSLGDLREERNLKILKNNVSGKKEWLPVNLDPRKRMYSTLYIILKNKNTRAPIRTTYQCGEHCASIENYEKSRSYVSKENDIVMSIYVIENYEYKEIYNYHEEKLENRI